MINLYPYGQKQRQLFLKRSWRCWCGFLMIQAIFFGALFILGHCWLRQQQPQLAETETQTVLSQQVAKWSENMSELNRAQAMYDYNQQRIHAADILLKQKTENFSIQDCEVHWITPELIQPQPAITMSGVHEIEITMSQGRVGYQFEGKLEGCSHDASP